MPKTPNYPTVKDAAMASADWPGLQEPHLGDYEMDGSHGAIPRFYSYAAVAKMFDRTPRTVRWWVKSGQLKAITIGCARYIPDSEIHRLNSDGEG